MHLVDLKTLSTPILRGEEVPIEPQLISNSTFKFHQIAQPQFDIKEPPTPRRIPPQRETKEYSISISNSFIFGTYFLNCQKKKKNTKDVWLPTNKLGIKIPVIDIKKKKKKCKGKV